MASVRSTIDLLVIGATRGLSAAAAEARRTAERIAAAEDRVADARRRSAESESRVADVEARLEGARARHTAALSQIGVAETNLARVRDASNGATTRLSQAEDRLEALRQGGASAETIARAEADIARVRTEADSAAANLQRAEAQLERARANATARAGEITALEERLAQARGQAFRDSEALAQAEERLRLARSRGTDDLNRQRDGVLGLFDAFRNLAQAFSGADGASTSLLAKLGALNTLLTTIGGPIVQAVVGILEFAAVLGAIGEIVGVVGGLIGQALAGVPVLLFAIGAAAGTVALGMDGIKKAAEAAAPAFERLKKAVSDEFAKQLTPVFQQLAKDIPLLTENFRDIAASVADLGARLVGVISSAKGMDRLQLALAGTADLVRGIGPGIAALFDGIIRAAAAAAPAMEQLGQAIGSIGFQIGDAFSRLAADGTIQRAIQGLSATITGLGRVIGPIIELLIRMGAALGTSLGTALTGIGSGIQQVIPFFEKLAQVAGTILVDAFNQLGPPLSQLVETLLPGASQGMDGFARLMHDVVLPAIAGFINFLRTDGIPAIVEFFRGALVQAIEFAKGVVTAIGTVLGVLHGLFTALALIPGPMQESFAKAAAVTAAYQKDLEGLKTTLNGIESKVIAFKVEVPSDRTTGEQGVLGVAAAMDRVQPKTTAFTVQVPSDRTTGEQGILGVAAAQARLTDKTVTTTANVPSGPTQGTLGNQVLEGAIGAVLNKSVTTTAQVPGSPTQGTQGNQALTGAINNVNGKTVQVTANVSGESAVRSLVSAIAAVHDKTVTIVSNVINNVVKAFADGGRVPTSGQFLVGERGPELLTLDAFGGVITPAAKTRQMINAQRNRHPGATGFGADSGSSGGEVPITVNVMLSQEQIAGIAQVEIARQNRATKRTVLAGSGVTY